MRDVVFGVSRASAITTTQADPSLPPPEQHNNGHNWPVGRAAGNLQSTKPLLTSLLSRPRLCQGLQRYRGARSSHNREIDGRTNLLSTPATLTLGLFIFIMFNNYFKLFLFSRNDNNCILDIEITITISIASDASVDIIIWKALEFDDFSLGKRSQSC